MSGEPKSAPSVEHLQALLQLRLNGRVRDLRLSVRGRGLILQGWTSTYHVKQLAQHAAVEISGLTILANEIEVR